MQTIRREGNSLDFGTSWRCRRRRCSSTGLSLGMASGQQGRYHQGMSAHYSCSFQPHRPALPRTWRAVVRLLLCSAALWCLFSLQGCAWLDVSLRNAAFRPTAATQSDLTSLASDVEVYFVPVEPGGSERISLYWFPAHTPGAPTVLYLHGVFRHVIQNAPKIEAIRASGFNVLAVDYRGWGLSTPLVPSEQSIARDADLAFDALKLREPQASKRMVFGHSLGGAVAVSLAQRQGSQGFARLALESTFASTRSLTIHSRWYGFLFLPLVGNPFDSLAVIAQLGIPVSMMHGALDNTIAISEGKKLHAAAALGTPWVVVEQGHHSDLHTADKLAYREYWTGLRALFH